MNDAFDADAWLAVYLESSSAGVPITDPSARTRPVELVASVAAFLSRLHGLTPVDGPDRTPMVMLDSLAAHHIASGGDADDPRLVGARALCPSPPQQPSITLGGVSLASLAIDDGVVCSWTPTEWAGVGDPAWDVATLARDLHELVGPEAGAMLIDHYTGAAPSMLRLEFWALIDQLR